MSPDPAGQQAIDPSNPQTWNRYAYVAGYPLWLIDPLGLCGDDGDPCEVPPTIVDVVASAPNPVAGIVIELPWEPLVARLPNQLAANNAARIARCAAKVGNSLSLAALLPQGSNQFLQNALSNDFSTVSDLVTGPAGATRLDAAASVLQGRLTTTAVKAVGAIPVGPEVYTLGVNGAGTTFVEDVVTTPLAEKALGKAAGALLGTAVDIKLAWDAATYAYGVAKCW